jgi:hypothetical protein
MTACKRTVIPNPPSTSMLWINSVIELNRATTEELELSKVIDDPAKMFDLNFHSIGLSG